MQDQMPHLVWLCQEEHPVQKHMPNHLEEGVALWRPLKQRHCVGEVIFAVYMWKLSELLATSSVM